jgi:hypothetical protein
MNGGLTVLSKICGSRAREISWAISQSDPAKDGLDLSLLEHVSAIEWDNVVLYGQYILDRKLARRRRTAASSLTCEITPILPGTP